MSKKLLITSSHSAVKEGVLSSLPPGLAPSAGLGLPGPCARDPEPQLCSSCKGAKYVAVSIKQAVFGLMIYLL